MWIRSLGLEDPLEEDMEPTPVFLPGEFHEQRSLVACSPWNCKVRHNSATEHSELIWLRIPFLRSYRQFPAAYTVSQHGSLLLQSQQRASLY